MYSEIEVNILCGLIILLPLHAVKSYYYYNYYHCHFQDGMQVIDEKHFAVTGGNTLDWVQFGLHIEVPEGSIQAGNTIELHVMAIIGGDFILLPDCYLVSGIYQISSSEQFKKNITLHLPHAAIIKSEEEASYFRFYTADCSSGPPYEFKEMQGGAFIPFHNSASIDVHHFSCFATGAIIPPNQRYLSQVLYKSAVSYSVKKWNMVFAITKNDPSFVKVQLIHVILILCSTNFCFLFLLLQFFSY